MDIQIKSSVNPHSPPLAQTPAKEAGDKLAVKAPHSAAPLKLTPLKLEPVKNSASSAASSMQDMQKELAHAISQLNDQMKKESRNLSFSFDDVVNKPVVIVKDANNGHVIRQIPSESVLKVAHSLDQLKGLLLDERH